MQTNGKNFLKFRRNSQTIATKLGVQEGRWGFMWILTSDIFQIFDAFSKIALSKKYMRRNSSITLRYLIIGGLE